MNEKWMKNKKILWAIQWNARQEIGQNCRYCWGNPIQNIVQFSQPVSFIWACLTTVNQNFQNTICQNMEIDERGDLWKLSCSIFWIV